MHGQLPGRLSVIVIIDSGAAVSRSANSGSGAAWGALVYLATAGNWRNLCVLEATLQF